MDSETINNILQSIIEELKLRKYSPRTVSVYVYFIRRFLEANCSYRSFFVRLSDKSENTIRLASAAIRFYLKHSNVSFEDFKLPKKPKRLPVVLSKKEIERMISVTANLKHKLIISLLYSAGLRLSELINLRWEDVDLVRNIINIRKGKGNKDRVSLLSKKVKRLLKEYRLTCEESKYIFPGRKGSYSPKMVQEVVKKASKKARVHKNVSPHVLRHSFATHLLEQGINIRSIQRLLGHETVRTTQVYTHVATSSFRNIKNPLD